MEGFTTSGSQGIHAHNMESVTKGYTDRLSLGVPRLDPGL